MSTLPEITLRELSIGPVRAHPFGVLVALGLVAFHLGFVKRAGLARARGRADRLAIAATGAGLLGVLVVLPVLTGALSRVGPLMATLSTLGAAPFAAAGLAVACLATGTPVRRAFDHAALAFVPAMLVARTGCALVHDHLGRESGSLLAIAFESGPRRFDLGVLEWLGLLPLAALVSGSSFVPWLRARAAWLARVPGRTAAGVAMAYATLRMVVERFGTGPFPTPTELVCAVVVVACAAFMGLARPE